MIIFIRNTEDKTLAEITVYNKREETCYMVEVRCLVDITNYSALLTSDPEKSPDVIKDFNFIQEIRGWYFEKYYPTHKNDSVFTVCQAVEKQIAPICERHGLKIVHD